MSKRMVKILGGIELADQSIVLGGSEYIVDSVDDALNSILMEMANAVENSREFLPKTVAASFRGRDSRDVAREILSMAGDYGNAGRAERFHDIIRKFLRAVVRRSIELGSQSYEAQIWITSEDPVEDYERMKLFLSKIRVDGIPLFQITETGKLELRVPEFTFPDVSDAEWWKKMPYLLNSMRDGLRAYESGLVEYLGNMEKIHENFGRFRNEFR